MEVSFDVAEVIYRAQHLLFSPIAFCTFPATLVGLALVFLSFLSLKIFPAVSFTALPWPARQSLCILSLSIAASFVVYLFSVQDNDLGEVLFQIACWSILYRL